MHYKIWSHKIEKKMEWKLDAIGLSMLNCTSNMRDENG